MSTYFTILLWKQLQKSYIMSNKVFDEGNAASEGGSQRVKNEKFYFFRKSC